MYKSDSRINFFIEIACVNLSMVFSYRNVHDFMTIVRKPHASITILVIFILAKVYFHELQPTDEAKYDLKENYSLERNTW